MKPATTLKELLKPPFERNGRSIYDGAGRLLTVLETFGKGFVVDQDKTNAAGDFVVAALNEKWESDFSEPLRWEINKEPQPFDSTILKDFIYHCPKCNVVRDVTYDYCPHCGQRLFPPEATQNNELKPCPFCGNEGLPGTDRTLHYVFCSKCEA